jgi:lipopolysaccharide/colanic/teichoic acid biosynthesis glycosyltransferase
VSTKRGISPGPARRTLDVVASTIALVVLAPLFAVLWILIRLTSRGPAIYKQARVGQGGRRFTLYKFRTMRLSSGGPAVTVPGDSRVTRVGRILRRTSLDELPQLVNVLLGQMTLVGARPETPDLAARYPDPCKRVFDFRPGLTGPGQLQFRDEDVIPPDLEDLESFYLEVVTPQRAALDLRYLEHPRHGETWRLLMATYGEVAKPLRRAGGNGS